MPKTKTEKSVASASAAQQEQKIQTDLPLFAQVQQSLRQSILEKQLAPGQKLPSESKLQAQFGVSRITVRQALSALQAEGLVETFNGKGSFVTRPSNAPQLGMLTGFYEHMRSKGHHAQGKTLSVRTVKASVRVAQSLKLAVGAPLTCISHVRLVDGEAIVCGKLFAPPAMAEALLAHDLETADTMSVLEANLGYRLESTHIEASAVAAGVERGKILNVAPDTPLLYVSFVPHDIENQPLIYAQMYFRPDKFTYRAVIRR
nr:GntR family transcriptional regulator [uncultured Comamonas sp.]